MKNKEGWEKKTIDDCFETIRNGANIKQNDIHGGIPITRIETISNSIFNRDRLGYANIVNSNDYSKYILNDGDILMSHINSLKYLGRAVLYKKDNNEEIIHGMNLLNLIAKREIIKPQYITYYFCSDIFKSEIYRIAKKSVNQASFTTTDLKKIKVSIPPLPIQHQIVSELDTLSDIISKKKQQLEELDKLAQATFYDMFGDPVSNDKGWEVKKLKEIGKVQTGNTPPRAEKRYYGSYIEWIKTDNILMDKPYPRQATEFLSEEGLKKGRSVEAGSVLVTCIAGSSNSIGNVVLTNKKVSFNQQINSLSPKSNYNEFFIYSLFKYCKSVIQENTTQGMKRIITKSVFENIEFISPPILLQNSFAIKAKSIENQKALINQSIGDVQQLFDYTMDKYFN